MHPNEQLLKHYGTEDFYASNLEKRAGVFGALSAMAISHGMGQRAELQALEAERLNYMLRQLEAERQARVIAGLHGRGALSSAGQAAQGFNNMQQYYAMQSAMFKGSSAGINTIGLKKVANAAGVNTLGLKKVAIAPANIQGLVHDLKAVRPTMAAPKPPRNPQALRDAMVDTAQRSVDLPTLMDTRGLISALEQHHAAAGPSPVSPLAPLAPGKASGPAKPVAPQLGLFDSRREEAADSLGLLASKKQNEEAPGILSKLKGKALGTVGLLGAGYMLSKGKGAAEDVLEGHSGYPTAAPGMLRTNVNEFGY